MKDKQLSSLADNLISSVIRNKTDCFDETVVVFPNLIIEQWFKAYWLKTQNDNVLMNVSFKTLNEIMPKIIEGRNYKVISKSNLKILILSVLSNDDKNIIPQEYKDYYKDNPIKLNDFASTLVKLFLEYYEDDFFNSETFKNSNLFNFYSEILLLCNKHNFGTLESPKAKKCNSKKIYLFGFNKLNMVHQRLIEECDYIEDYSLEKDNSTNKKIEIISAPSKLREIEYVHSSICKLIKDGAKATDFYVVSPNINEYANEIERVFNQNDIDYPSIPYSLRKTSDIQNDVIDAVKKLFDIGKNGNFTRLDFYNLISNPVIKLVRKLNDDQIEDIMRAVVNLNIFRDHPLLNDWTYFKNRILLSKISSINFDDNIVKMSDSDYIPYSNISFDDDLINKVVGIIDDLYELIDLFKRNEYLSNSLIDEIKSKLDKWIYLEDNNAYLKQYSKILMVLNSFKEVDNKNLNVDNLFYVIFDDGNMSSMQKNTAFTSGVTFADFNINSIVSSKYIYFLGASSNNIPVAEIKSELDLREKEKNNDDELCLSLLYQNASEKMFVSFTNIDLETDEEFYLSPIVDLLLKRGIGCNLIKADLDETRPYDDLFTRKEFGDKDYYQNLLSLTQSSVKAITPSEPIFYETISARKLADYLSEPLSAKIKNIFNYNDDLQDDIKDEYEPFSPNNLDKSNVVNHLIIEKITNRYEKEKFLKYADLNNFIPTVTKNYELNVLNSYDKIANKAIDYIKENATAGIEIKENYSLKLFDDNKEWNLLINNAYVKSTNKNEISYFELKEKIKREISITDFMNLYIIALADVITLNTNETYHIILCKNDQMPTDKNPYRKGKWEFDINSDKAKEILNEIHRRMGDYSCNIALPVKNIKGVKDGLTTFEKYKDCFFGEHGSWKYFDYKNMFSPEQDLGFNHYSYNKTDFDKEMKKHLALIAFLDFKEE